MNSKTLLRPYTDFSPTTLKGALTLSAGVITDVTRLAGVGGDGVTPPDGSVYVGPAATNLGDTVGDMSFESLAVGSNMAADGWTNSTGGTAVISDEVVKFGTKSGKLTTGGASLYQRLELPFTSTPGTYTWSVWLYAPSPLTKVRLAFGGPTDGAVLSNELTVADEWVQFSVTKTITVTETVKATIYVSYGVNTSGAVLYVSGPMPVLSPIALPFTPTSRVAGTITIQASVLDETQMWVACRYKTGDVSSMAWSSPDSRLFWWGANDARITLYRATANQLDCMSDAGTNYVASTALSYVVGDYVLAIGAVRAGAVYVSANGGAFANTARLDVPVIAAATAGIGNRTDVSTAAGMATFEWAAFGKGTLTDADAALFNSWGNNDPLPHMFPRSAQLTALLHFNGDGTLYRYAV